MYSNGLDDKIISEFVGYDALTAEGKVVALATETELVNTLKIGETGTLITDVTPFYATMGGQKGDFGVIRTENGTFEVTETVKIAGGRIGHVVRSYPEQLLWETRQSWQWIPTTERAYVRTIPQPICYRRHCRSYWVIM